MMEEQTSVGSGDDALRVLLDAWCAEAELPGITVGVRRPDGSVFSYQQGKRGDEPVLPVTDNTLFGVASVTKSFTTLATVLLDQAGRLSLDDPVSRWIPALRLPGGAESEVRIRHLASHTSGLPGLPYIHGARTPGILADPDHDRLRDRAPIASDWAWIRTTNDLVAALSRCEYELLGAPGAVFNYSNEGFGLLQAVIEAAVGMPYIDYLSGAIFAPLGIERFGFTAADLVAKGDIAQLFAPMREAVEAYSPSPAWWDVGDIYSNGSLKISSAALLRVLEALCGFDESADSGTGMEPGSAETGRIGSPFDTRIRELLTEVQAVLPDGGFYALGTEVGEASGQKWFGHGGSIKGVSTNYRCYPETGWVLVCLINASGAPAAGLTDRLANYLLGKEEAGSRDFASSDTGGHTVDLDLLQGHYESGELNEFDVGVDEGVLVVRANGSPTPLELTPVESSHVRNAAFVSPAGASFVFECDATDQAVSLFTSKRVHPRTD
ncbi:beta-lactamase family protein [Brevibacterium sp. 91QC2O2]|uniref:serine hydrolase domain-containing protein n=1 Tax=Brevibacterium TaxID=1696 RepID=UPI00211CD688|nr:MULTISPECIES: serine hydrolase domain-containing protein [unclassified Brevibacterium]MCQ9368853.1 beta-lactamase family protein [Brevibacterium sp. 91QC2O2]MCQ9386648.1 beta-lactamase family protein [Brevibacterium sp. 68QC2CO]